MSFGASAPGRERWRTMAAVLDDLSARGLIQDHTDLEDLGRRLDEGPIALYYGCDPSADSLHLGNLIGLLILRRFAEAGHRPIALVGGATGMIGDPGGRSEERNLLSDEELAHNVAGIRAQVEHIVGSVSTVVDNSEWTRPIGVLEFLRDVGKHVTVNQMLARESIRSRVESEQGISFTEFSYMLLQANDYWHLHATQECALQIGGSDQWGNIVAGVDLIRRRSGAAAHAFTWPLITRADGAKFGKSTGDAIWLSAERTSPFQLFQYLMNVDDRDVERFLLQLTMLPVTECAEIASEHATAPAQRAGQRRLAGEVTELVHGPAQRSAAEEASSILFGGDASDASAEALAAVAGEVITVPLGPDGADLVDVLCATGLASSKGDARRHLAGKAIAVNGEPVTESRMIGVGDLRHGRYVLLRRGKKAYAMVDAGISSPSS